MSSVFPGVALVLANFRLLVSILIKLDLPTFDRPINAYSALVSLGHMLTIGALITNSAFFISMSCIYFFMKTGISSILFVSILFLTRIQIQFLKLFQFILVKPFGKFVQCFLLDVRVHIPPYFLQYVEEYSEIIGKSGNRNSIWNNVQWGNHISQSTDDDGLVGLQCIVQDERRIYQFSTGSFSYLGDSLYEITLRKLVRITHKIR